MATRCLLKRENGTPKAKVIGNFPTQEEAIAWAKKTIHPKEVVEYFTELQLRCDNKWHYINDTKVWVTGRIEI